MKRLEIILILGALVGLLMSLFDVPLNSLIVSVFFIALGILYFYMGFALFNDIPLRKLFKAESYKGVGPWKIGIAIATGIALSNLTMGFMFSILNYPMSETLLTFGIALAAIVILLALIKNARDKNPFYRNIIIRCIVFIVIAVALLLLPWHIFDKP